MPRKFPSEYAFVRWLKPGTVAVVRAGNGELRVIKRRANAARLAEFYRRVRRRRGILKDIILPMAAENSFVVTPFVRGQASGDTTVVFGFRKATLQKINPAVLGRGVSELQALSGTGFARRLVKDRRPARWYVRNIAETRPAIRRIYGGAFFRRVEARLRRTGRPVDKAALAIANADLHPENIWRNCVIRGKRRKLLLMDWDIMTFTNPGYDIALLYVWAWRNDVWRRRLLEAFRKLYPGEKSEFDACFEFSAAYLAAQLMKHSLLFETPASRELRRRCKILLDGILKA